MRHNDSEGNVQGGCSAGAWFLAAATIAVLATWSEPAWAQATYEPAEDDGWIEAWCETWRANEAAVNCFAKRRAAWDECNDAASYYRCTADLHADELLTACDTRFCGAPVIPELPTWNALTLACEKAPARAPATGRCEFELWDRAYEHADPAKVVECLGGAVDADARQQCWTRADADTRTYLLDHDDVDHERRLVAERIEDAQPHVRLADTLVDFVRAFEDCATPQCHAELGVELEAWSTTNADHLGASQRAVVAALSDGVSLRLRHDLEQAELDAGDTPDPATDDSVGLDARRYEFGFSGCSALDPVLGHAATFYCTPEEAAGHCGEGDPRLLVIPDTDTSKCSHRLIGVWAGIVVDPLSYANEERIAALCDVVRPRLASDPGGAVCRAVVRGVLWQKDDLSCIETADDDSAFWACLHPDAQ